MTLESDQEELKILQAAVASAEQKLMGSPKSEIMQNFVQSAKQQLQVLEKRIKEMQLEIQHREASTVAALVEREARLNAEEKEEYAGFLKKDFFTKADFGKLESFYGRSYDKLTEAGKTEMSHRVWEGVRRGEYRVDELPEIVLEKEAKFVHESLERGGGVIDPTKISQAGKDDFMSAYEAGRKRDAYKVLERAEYVNAISLSSESTGATEKKSSRVDTGVEQSGSSTAKKTIERPDATSVDLSGLVLQDSTGEISSSNIPTNKSGSTTRER